jgi:hypothetical protein
VRTRARRGTTKRWALGRNLKTAGRRRRSRLQRDEWAQWFEVAVECRKVLCFRCLVRAWVRCCAGAVRCSAVRAMLCGAVLNQPATKIWGGAREALAPLRKKHGSFCRVKGRGWPLVHRPGTAAKHCNSTCQMKPYKGMMRMMRMMRSDWLSSSSWSPAGRLSLDSWFLAGIPPCLFCKTVQALWGRPLIQNVSMALQPGREGVARRSSGADG